MSSVTRLCVRFIALSWVISIAAFFDSAAASPAGGQNASVSAAPQGITPQAWAGIQRQIVEAQYEAVALPSVPNTIGAHNARQDLHLLFGEDGALINSRRSSEPGARSLGLQTLAISRGTQRIDAEPVPAVAEGARVEYRRGGWTEWFVNGADGVEHGYTLLQRPLSGTTTRTPNAPVRISLSVSGMQVGAQPDGSLQFSDGLGGQLRYDKLIVKDADGQLLPSMLATAGTDRAEIVFDDRAARYPVTVDPLLVNEERLLENPGDDEDAYVYRQFGGSVSLGDGVLMVGAPGALGRGAVYVFEGAGGDWTLKQRLTADDSNTFGASISMDGDTVLIGSYSMAYVFTRSAEDWVLQSALKAGDGAGDFGLSVALSGDTALVGASSDAFGTKEQRGSVFVFVRSGATWTQQTKLVASDAAKDDRFGSSVALEGDFALVGAPLDDVGANNEQGSAYVFVRSGTAWTQQAQLTALDGTVGNAFGTAAALSADTALIGSAGAAYVFVRNGTNWNQQSKLSADDGPVGNFGDTVALSGDSVIIGARGDNGATSYEGSAYIFVRSGTIWTQQAKIRAEDSGQSDAFGIDVALFGDTILVGAFGDDFGSYRNQGSAYVFTRSAAAWTQQSKLTTSDGAVEDNFGQSVAVSGDTLLVGAPGDDLGANIEQGSVFVFVRSGSDWIQSAKLVAADGAEGDHFGISVALSGNTALIGADLHQVGSNSGQGAVYVYLRSGDTWEQQALLTAADGAKSDQFGVSVALSGETALIGTEGANAAYVFVRSGLAWAQQAKMTGGGHFGHSVAISNDTAVIGAYGEDIGGIVDQGTATIFVRSGTSWSQQAKLKGGDGGAYDYFGYSVAISADTALVGAQYHADQGQAYVFVRSGSSWIQQAKLTASDGAAADYFGHSVALAGDIALIGASFNTIGKYARGAAYVFVRVESNWKQQQDFHDPDGTDYEFFGGSVALSGSAMVVGAPGADVPEGLDGGSVHIYRIASDYGDAPQPYPTKLVDDGPRHFINTDGPYLGSAIDAETDGAPSSGATGDDIATSDDEDGVTLPKLIPGQKAKLTVVATAPAGTAQLDAWIDFNADGDWSDAGEQIFVKTVVSNGTNTLKFTVPTTTAIGQTYARFRISPADSGGVKATGKVIFGEVEDYIVKVKAP
ncbi:GEVED domain-containing protein [Hydrocarboniphaga sp.]|uniref:GEVED domain-containing protein n=1 Tax=Hydrocarboniphaga sp. TaxID=2033016 RepID=UPI003D119D82